MKRQIFQILGQDLVGERDVQSWAVAQSEAEAAQLWRERYPRFQLCHVWVSKDQRLLPFCWFPAGIVCSSTLGEERKIGKL